MAYKSRIRILPVLLCAGIFGLLAVATIYYIAKGLTPVAQNHSPERLAAIANQGIHCNNGKAWNTSVNSSGFQMSEAVVVDGQFVECAMVYKVNGHDMTLEELFVKMFRRAEENKQIDVKGQ